MTRSERFSDIGVTYPGSKQKRREPARQMASAQAEEAEDRWDAKPRVYKIDGEDIEFFTIGQLAKGLGGRSAVTLRKWEDRGWLPPATFRTPKRGKGGQRLYTRAQCEGIIRIAEEEGLLDMEKVRRGTNDDRAKAFTEGRFPAKVWDLFGKLERR